MGLFEGAQFADFIQYWTAARLFCQGINPYDAHEMLEAQRAVGFLGDAPVMFWSPPWSLLFFAPVLIFDIALSNILFLCLSVVAMAAAGYLSGRAFDSSAKRSVYYVLSALIFVPFWNALDFGQTSSFLAFGVALLYWSLCQRRYRLAGLSLVILSIKPHLFLLLLTALFWWAIKKRHFEILFWALGGFFVLIGITFVVSPAAIGYWVECFGADNGVAVHRLSWVVSTGVGLARSLLASDGNLPAWPTVVLPSVLFAALLLYLSFRQPRIEWLTAFLPLLFLSYFFSPYGWFYDQSILFLLQADVVRRCFLGGVGLRQRAQYLSLLAILQLTAVIWWRFFANFQSEFFWFPLALMAIWYGAFWHTGSYGGTDEAM